ncbi:MAG TPA: bifunctional DNA primase/polymerase [Thermoguttaceae bacterium]|nr:bifunctional DNA primase/polymerase [Thermoguttaceae bacterium]
MIRKTTPRIDAACQYASRGYKVFPLVRGLKAPHRSLAWHGVHDATDNEATIRRWFDLEPTANIGLSCDGLLVIDCDRGNKWSAVERLKEDDRIPMQNSPRGGLHFLFRCPEGKAWRNSQGCISRKIDTKTTGGYIVVEPSHTIDSPEHGTIAGDYFFESPLPPFDELPYPPDWLVEELDAAFGEPQQPEAPTRQLASSCPGDETDIVSRAIAYLDACPPAISGNGGHNRTFSVAQALVNGFCLDPEEALVLLAEYYNPRCEPPWDEKDLQHKVDSALKTPPDKSRGWLLDGSCQDFEAEVDLSRLLANLAKKAEEGEEEAPFGDFRVWDCPELMGADLRQDFLIENVLVENQPCIVGGPKKCLKTSVLLDMALSLAAGVPFLRQFEVPRPRSVLVMTGESGLVTIRNTIQRIAESADIDPEVLKSFFICDRVPKLDNIEHLAILAAILERLEPDVVIFDPAYLMLTTDKPESLFATGSQLASITQLCQSHGATIVLAHHTSKGRNDFGRTPDLDDLSWSGFSEFARQWVLLCRNKAFDPMTGEHDLKVLVGGSFGHGGEYEVAIREGLFPDRTWDVELLAIGGIVGQGESLEVKHQRKVLDALAEHPEGMTKSKLKNATKLRNDKVGKVIDQLVESGILEECVLPAPNGQAYSGCRLVQKND